MIFDFVLGVTEPLRTAKELDLPAAPDSFSSWIEAMSKFDKSSIKSKEISATDCSWSKTTAKVAVQRPSSYLIIYLSIFFLFLFIFFLKLIEWWQNKR